MITLSPDSWGWRGTGKKSQPLLYLDVPSTPKVPNMCLSQETVAGQRGVLEVTGCRSVVQQHLLILSDPGRLRSSSFRRSEQLCVGPVPQAGKLSFPTLPVSSLENPQENLFTLGVSAQPRTPAQGRAGSRSSLPATRGVGLCVSLLGWLSPGAPRGPDVVLRGH